MMSDSPRTVISTILEQSSRVLQTYEVDPGLIPEHANGERRITQGDTGTANYSSSFRMQPTKSPTSRAVPSRSFSPIRISTAPMRAPR